VENWTRKFWRIGSNSPNSPKFSSTKILYRTVSGNDLQTGFNRLSHILQNMSSLMALDISDANLTATSISDLVSVIKCNCMIQQLLLSDNTFQSGLLDVVRACCLLPDLQTLDLSHNNCTAIEIDELALNVAMIKSLKALMLGGITLDQTKYFHMRIVQIVNLARCSSSSGDSNNMLEVVCLEMQKYFLSKVIKNLDYCGRPLFTSVRLSNHMIDQFLSHTLTYQIKLSHIDSITVISTLAETIKGLKTLDLEYSNIGEEAASKLAAALHHNDVMRQLWLRGNLLCDGKANLILSSLKHQSTLIVLDLSFNNITSRSCSGIAAVINSNHFLEQLWLDGNSLLSNGIITIANALKCHSRLKLLSLSNNGITDDAAAEISEIIANNISLEDLSLGNNQLKSSGICKMATALIKMERLRKLDLFNNLLTKEAADDLAAVIKNSVIQELYLGNNMLETTGIIKILEAAKNISSLRVLTLSNNSVTKEAASCICEVLIINYSLGILLVGGNDLQTDGVVQIAGAASINESLRLLAVCDNNVDEQKKEEIKIMFSDRSDLKVYV